MKWISWASFSLLTILLTNCGKESKPANQSGNSVAVLTISDSPVYNYGVRTVDTATDHTFTVTNIGSNVATQLTGSFYLSLSFAYKDGGFPGTDGTCTSELKVGESCTITVSFTPKFAGAVQSLVSLNFHNGSSLVTFNGPALTGQGN